MSDIADPTLRDKLARITYYLADLSRGMGRIQQGLVPDGSGDPISSITDDGLYLKLLGRPGNQDAHGGTGPAGTLTLSSTTASTKGLIYLGDAKTSSYDEVNDRIGVGTVSPAARLHLYHSTGSGTDTFTCIGDNGTCSVSDCVDGFYQAPPVGNPTSQVAMGGAMPTTFFNCYKDAAGNYDNVITRGYQAINSSNGFTSCLGSPTLNSTSDFLLSGALDRTRTYSVVFSVSKFFGGTLSANSNLRFEITMSDGTFWRVENDLQPLVTDSFQTLTWTGFTEVGSPRTANSIRVQLVGAGWGATYIAISYIAVTAPGLLGTTPLQRWSDVGGDLNDLNYVADSAAATTLQLSGTPKFRITSGLELAIGSPTVSAVWTASDTDGTGAWASASGLATKIQHRFVANGPYRIDGDVDGAMIAQRAMTLTKFNLYRRLGGTSGSTAVDLRKNGATVLSTVPGIAFNAGASATASGIIGTAAVAAGDRITVSASAVDGGQPYDWVALVEGY